MNADLTGEHVTVEYYDSDYPSAHFGAFPENVDDVTEYQGVRHDVERYIEIAREAGGPILELCCGTGRVAIPLAQAGFDVTGVDLNGGFLDTCRHNLDGEPAEVRSRVRVVGADVTSLDLGDERFPLIICAFNSLLAILDADAQIRALQSARRHLAAGGRLVVDVVNPLVLDLKGNDRPRPFFTRRNTQTGRTYTRFAMNSPLDATQCQRLHGWYDEVDEDGHVLRKYYAMRWRAIFRYELELMMRLAGLEIETIAGGHCGELFTANSPHIFATAVAAR